MSKTLLMIHGVGCGGEVWDRMKRDFAMAGWTCETPTLFPELRTNENPPEALADLTLSDYVEAAAKKAETIAQHDGEKPVVIGHSMGGMIAQRLAERGAVRGAIFLTPAQPEGCTVTDLRVLRTFWSILKVGQKNVPGGVFKVGPNGFRWGVLNAVDKARHDEIYSGALYDSGRVYDDLANPGPVDEARITIPTLTIGAKKDRATVIKAVRKVGAKYAKASVPGDYFEYANHAHWIVDEPGTEQVSADIMGWLDEKLS
ncbi:MAG: alpha/beta fold hydrolase [Alphaproteobacteria bacterium]|nr:alpha/beta fold hydrolase [Alphaproteobacteria bacterium]